MKKIGVLFAVSLALFMESVDTTILNTAIPVMAKSFQVHPIDLKLALISYLLSLAIFIPISGWVADKFGIKQVFIAALVVFTLSSLWCGLTQNLNELILARILQGIGGSFTLPLGRLIILKSYPRKKLLSKMSVVIMVASLGMMLGPLLGGLIVNHIFWRWIFWVNVPVGIIAIVLSLKTLPSTSKIAVHPLDILGFILFGSGLATLTYGLSTISESTIPLIHSLLTLVGSLIILACYFLYSRNKPYPIIKVELLTIRTFRIAVMGNLLTRLSFGGVPFLLPLLLQLIFKYSAQLSGLLLAPIALGVFAAKPLSFRILRVLGYKRLLVLNTLLISASLGSFALIGPSTSLYLIGVLTFIYGFLVALQYTGMNSMAYANVQDSDVSTATSIMSTAQQLAQSFGVAVSAILVSFFIYEFSNETGLTLKTFQETFGVLTVLTLLSGLVFLKMKEGDGKELIGDSN